MASALLLGQPPGLVIPPGHLGETPRARKRAFHQSVRRAKSFSARRGRVEILGQPPIAPLLSVDPRLGLPAGALQPPQFVHQIENDLGLAADRPVTAHLFLQAVRREPEPAGSLSVAQAEPINTGALASLDPSIASTCMAVPADRGGIRRCPAVRGNSGPRAAPFAKFDRRSRKLRAIWGGFACLAGEAPRSARQSGSCRFRVFRAGVRAAVIDRDTDRSAGPPVVATVVPGLECRGCQGAL